MSSIPFSGFVHSFARPGGNVTGFQTYEFTIAGKWPQLLVEIAPSVRRIGMIHNPTTAPLVSVRKHFESFESFVIQSGDLIREGHHRCGRRRTADVTTAANCDIRVT